MSLFASSSSISDPGIARILDFNSYPTRVTASMPQKVIEALHEMLGDDAELTPIQLPLRS